MRWALRRGTATLAALNVFALVLAVRFFYGLCEMSRRTPGRYRRPFSLLV